MTKLPQENVSYKSRVSSISIGEWMYKNQAMMKSYCDLVDRKDLVRNPITHVSKQNDQVFTDLVNRNPDVLFGGAITPCPFPGSSKHFFMQPANEVVGCNLERGSAVPF